MEQTLVDRMALARRRARASGATFLHEEAAREVSERLAEVNKSFTAPAVIGPEAALWADLLGLDAVQVPDDDVLALEEGAHDLVVHGLALHWANDPVGQLVQMRRALRPDGLMLAALFGGETLQELRRAFSDAEVEVTGGLSPRVAPMGEIRDLGALLQRAGFALPVADAMPLTVDYADPLALMRDLRAMGETNVLAARHRAPLRRAVLMRAAELYHQHFARPDGRITATFEIVFLTGWAPAESQQKPLRPGSARTRLADALRVPEHSAGEKAGG
ncbi:methyltransferase domain-containing protein [Pontivivens ytuae]|uniref:SAM-dependent methyltransferase n=1 Tax=Pontivivens ytuae TaxID=2789856 RepID=A0A7S9QDY6_9RHOB|nr:methyltransferase domain-containing protein [Pontivivens ytuae]QPH55385.1 SAM-dependent methyltransferase [Pontivivens ytuae]